MTRRLFTFLSIVALSGALVSCFVIPLGGVYTFPASSAPMVGPMTVDGPLTVSGPLTVNGALIVHGKVKTRELDVNGGIATTLAPSTNPGAAGQSMSGPMTVQGALTVNGPLTVDGRLTVHGAVTAEGFEFLGSV